MNILIYSPVNFRCRDLESLAKEFVVSGHKVHFLTHSLKGEMHRSMSELGIQSYSYNPRGISKLLPKNIVLFLQLFRFYKQKEIDIVFSHLEPTNFLSVVLQLITGVKVVIFRHHIDMARIKGFDRSLSYRFTYQVAKNIVCVSSQAKSYMIREEKILGERIHHINLGYDFSLYSLPSKTDVENTREKYKCELLLIAVGRLTREKRFELAIELVKEISSYNIDVKLLILGVGDIQRELLERAKKVGVIEKIEFVGFVNNVHEYLSAADFLVHPSISESSCVTVKEAALVDLPVVVCKGVGDFDDYMVHGRNGIVVAQSNFVDEAELHIVEYYRHPEKYRFIPKNLKEEVKQRFSIKNTSAMYTQFLN